MICGVGRRRGSDPKLLWLWRRPVATAPIRLLDWEPPYASGTAQQIAKKKKKKKEASRRFWTEMTWYDLHFKSIFLCVCWDYKRKWAEAKSLTFIWYHIKCEKWLKEKDQDDSKRPEQLEEWSPQLTPTSPLLALEEKKKNESKLKPLFSTWLSATTTVRFLNDSFENGLTYFTLK